MAGTGDVIMDLLSRTCEDIVEGLLGRTASDLSGTLKVTSQVAVARRTDDQMNVGRNLQLAVGLSESRCNGWHRGLNRTAWHPSHITRD